MVFRAGKQEQDQVHVRRQEHGQFWGEFLHEGLNGGGEHSRLADQVNYSE